MRKTRTLEVTNYMTKSALLRGTRPRGQTMGPGSWLDASCIYKARFDTWTSAMRLSYYERTDRAVAGSCMVVDQKLEITLERRYGARLPGRHSVQTLADDTAIIECGKILG
jgi:hypothetical protein